MRHLKALLMPYCWLRTIYLSIPMMLNPNHNPMMPRIMSGHFGKLIEGCIDNGVVECVVCGRRDKHWTKP